MYTGQVATISNQATWTSDVYQLVDEDDDDAVIDITDDAIGFSATATIYDASNSVLATASTSNGQLTTTGTGDDIGLQWQFTPDDLSGICAGSYRFGLQVIVNGETIDLIDDGSVTIKQGNNQ